MAISTRIFSPTSAPDRDTLDDTIEDSFPASDPPSSNPSPSYASHSAPPAASPWRVEGGLAKAIEHQTAKLPSDTFLWAALGSMGVSAALQLSGKRQASLFIGQWAPAFLLLGVYNKLVKQLGSDAISR